LKDRIYFFNGAIGLLGKVFLETPLLSCPGVGNIFLLVKAKKGKEPSERVQNIISLPVITIESVYRKELTHSALSIS
jgi:hypothetical protein